MFLTSLLKKKAVSDGAISITEYRLESLKGHTVLSAMFSMAPQTHNIGFGHSPNHLATNIFQNIPVLAYARIKNFGARITACTITNTLRRHHQLPWHHEKRLRAEILMFGLAKLKAQLSWWYIPNTILLARSLSLLNDEQKR